MTAQKTAYAAKLELEDASVDAVASPLFCIAHPTMPFEALALGAQPKLLVYACIRFAFGFHCTEV